MRRAIAPGSLLALDAEIAAARKRLAAAKSARDACHKKYLDAWSVADALRQELERLESMDELGITFDGSRYWCGERSYLHLVNAVSYARVLLGLPSPDPKAAGTRSALAGARKPENP